MNEQGPSSIDDRWGAPEQPLEEPRGHDPTEDVRRRHLIWLGVVILLGFLMPVIVRGVQGRVRLVFPNLEFLEAGASWNVVLFLLYPAVAGVLVILLAAVGRGVARSAVLLGLGIVFVFRLVALETAGREGFFMLRGTPPSSVVWLVVSYLAFMGLFAGSRARSFRPGSRAAAVIGLAGAILFLVHLLAPLLPQEVGSVWVLTPFKMLESSRGVVMALATLGMIGCLTAASLLCIILVRPVRDVQGLAHKAFKLLVVACVVFGVGFLIGSIRDIAELENVSGAVVLAFFLMLIKMLCWVVGLLLLLPVGLTDLLVNLTPAGPAACAEPGDTPVDAPSTG